ncbi:hypothetical protein [Candidatus Pantoea persica]|uniref:hypothetical protein n=1 Tax=Candidatus Pantoea persica TaxID=2518128 RepID=UPI00215D67D0|nr:hypothetical protein [Candidatus Pantoea persica]
MVTETPAARATSLSDAEKTAIRNKIQAKKKAAHAALSRERRLRSRPFIYLSDSV